MDRAVTAGIAVLAFLGAAAFASCDGGRGGGASAAGGGGAGGGGVGGQAGAGRGGIAGARPVGGGGGTGSFPGVVPFDPLWTKTTPPDWVPYPIPDIPCDGCVYMNPDGVERLVDSVRAQRADGRWSVFGDLPQPSMAHKAAWAIDLTERKAYRVDDGCWLQGAGDKWCGGAAPAVDSGFATFGTSTSSLQAVLLRALSTGETKVLWKKTRQFDAQGQSRGTGLLATGMAYPYAFWVESGIYRLDLRDGTVVHNGSCDVIEAVTVARNGLACCDGYGQGALLIDFEHEVGHYPADFQDPDRVGIHSYLSKDGTELVWAEHPKGKRETDSYRIVYRNLVSGEERIIVNNDDPTVKRNEFPVVEGGVVFWERELVDTGGTYLRTTGCWKAGDDKPTIWNRHVGQFRFTPYGLLGTGFPDHVVKLPAPNLLFPYPEGYRPASMVLPAGP